MMNNRNTQRIRIKWPTAVLLACLIGLSGCAFPKSGPTTTRVLKAGQSVTPGLESIQVIDLTDAAVQRTASLQRYRSLFDMLGDAAPLGTVVERGDTLEVSIWEAPPAVLYGAGLGAGAGAGVASRAPAIPEQEVDSNGQITVPFVGKVNAAGRSPAQISAEIEARLIGKAHQPQVVVRRTLNSTANVTVVGDVELSRRMPLTAKGERLLDALASAGGTKEPIGKVTVQVTRGAKVVSVPLETVIRDPRQNIRLAPDDVITLLFQPYSFTALGAVGKSSEVPFEGTGLTLAQALGRIGGLDDQRSDPKGVFIFRMEYADTVEETGTRATPRTDVAMVPVIYRVDLRDPAALFLAQRFEIRNRDVLYVSNSPVSDFQRFLGLLSQAAFSVTGLGPVVN